MDFKYTFILAILFFFSFNTFAQNIGIGTNSPQAKLHIRDGVILIDSGRIEFINTGESLFIGQHAGENDDHTGNFNIGVGALALMANTSGANNVAVGGSALTDNEIGYQNTAIGRFALSSNVTQARSTAVGYAALRNAYNGPENSEMYNSAFGYEALRGSANPTINDGGENTAIGALAIHSNTTGQGNVALGVLALYNNTVGSYNTAIGYSAFHNLNNYQYSTGIGYEANPDANFTVRIGNASISTIGGYANWTNVSSDARIKTNVQENVPGLSFITQLRPVTYQLDMEAIAQITRTPDSLRLIDSEALKAAEIQSGFIAQEVEAAANAVGYDFHGVAIPAADHQHYGLRYAEFVVPIVKAVQELAEENEKLRKANEKLQQEVLTLKKLEDRLALLETRLDTIGEN